jgi:hypothetical protein
MNIFGTERGDMFAVVCVSVPWVVCAEVQVQLCRCLAGMKRGERSGVLGKSTCQLVDIIKQSN